jgi:cytochrome b561
MPEAVATEIVYHPVDRTVHWVNAILAAIAVLLAWGISGAPRHSGTRDLLIALHGSVGLVILVLMLFWLGWRLRHPSPPLRPVLTGIEILIARATHIALQLLFVLMPLSGYISVAAAGRRVSFFGIVAIPTLVPESGLLSQTAIALHLVGEFMIYGLVTAHIAAALMHGFIRRDGILERMLPRRSA